MEWNEDPRGVRGKLESIRNGSEERGSGCTSQTGGKRAISDAPRNFEVIRRTSEPAPLLLSTTPPLRIEFEPG
ncbi:hypothetical protein TNCV_2859111 [Trichonephila clavipes]|nr:hypothetical protein TNCV_2859111 [Trichonephila clavipes]